MTFQGFRPELIDFLNGLSVNNNIEWFDGHREQYENYYLEPAREFVVAMAECFSQLGSDIHAEPKVRGSIFAINRDIRFSKDKRPYKTQLDLWFWQGNGPSRERPGYFFRLTPETLMLGAGMHGFSDAQLERYRRAVLDPIQGPRLEQVARAIKDDPTDRKLDFGGQTYKRVPGGFETDHPRADWLRHSGLFAGSEQPLPTELYSPQLRELCFAHYQRLAPLQQWLVDLLPD
jgi:uncharacterized protein (TIGR02453 family)